jgi:murein DD-endopeptidase MepM/ murein hydrolase activator NlpD
MRSVALCVLFGVIALASLYRAGEARAQGQDEPKFSSPLGFRDRVPYQPRETRAAGGRLIEDTGYGVMNPDLRGSTCFGVAWEKLYHAGVDLYRSDGKSTAGAEVTAAADGKIVYANPDINYPGLVVIIEHDAQDGEKLYTVYAHLDDNSLEVKEGETVKAGQALGKVMYKEYTGRYPKEHPTGDDSHLHFEVRHFYNARNIYKDARVQRPGRGPRVYASREAGRFPRARRGLY